MTDVDIQSLERSVRARPDDEALRERLDAARFRLGLGWHGQKMPTNVFTHDPRVGGTPAERGVYRVRVPQKTFPLTDLEIPLVYVPGKVDRPSYSHTRADSPLEPCPECTAVAPFYMGRFPVTLGEWRACIKATWSRLDQNARSEHVARLVLAWNPVVNMYDYLHHPIVTVTLTEALDFCDWAGLRLPTETEWRLAALGGEAQKVRCRCVRRRTSMGDEWVANAICRDCHGSGRTTRIYPWGNKYPDSSLAVYRGTPLGMIQAPCSKPVVQWDHEHIEPDHDGTLRCVRCLNGGSFGPSRPLGQAWCGAHDMAGNVFEFVVGGLAFGGSFRSTDMDGWPKNTGPCTQPRDDVGFRVALSAPAS